MFKVCKVILVITIILSILYIFKEKKVSINYFFKEYNTSNIGINISNIKEEKDYFLILEIPSINLKKNVFDIGDYRNHIDINVQLLYKDEMYIIVSHSGRAGNAYFKNLYKVKLSDNIYIYNKNEKISYKVSQIYSINKKDDFGIKETFKNKLLLITCLNREKYLIVECERQNA